MNEIIQTMAVYALPVLFAITLHEAAHAYAAKYFGDSTAYAQGRMSLNPLKHIDPIGTLLIPIVLYFTTSGAFLFGYAKPVPLNYSALRNPRKQSALVAFAGPLANFVMALGWLVMAIIMSATGTQEPFFQKMASAGVATNLLIFAFNLFPLPPLDGGRILTSMLPPRLGYKFAQIEPYGFFIVLALALTQLLSFWIVPVKAIAVMLLKLLVSPLSLFMG